MFGFTVFRHCETFLPKRFNVTVRFWDFRFSNPILKTLPFLSLMCSADFRRPRLVSVLKGAFWVFFWYCDADESFPITVFEHIKNIGCFWALCGRPLRTVPASSFLIPKKVFKRNMSFFICCETTIAAIQYYAYTVVPTL